MAKELCPSKTYFFFSLQNRVYVGLVVLKLHMLARLQLKDIACLCLPSARSEGVPLGPASKTDLKKKMVSPQHTTSWYPVTSCFRAPSGPKHPLPHGQGMFRGRCCGLVLCPKECCERTGQTCNWLSDGPTNVQRQALSSLIH